MLKSKIAAIIICLSLTVPVYAEPESTLPQTERETLETMYPEHTQEEQQDIVKTEEETTVAADEQMENLSTPYKQPVSKRKIAKKFLLAMLGAVGSALVIFALLSLYNFIRYGTPKNQNTEVPHSEGESSLETPDNIVDAVKTFMDKTNWD